MDRHYPNLSLFHVTSLITVYEQWKFEGKKKQGKDFSNSLLKDSLEKAEEKIET